MSAPWRRSPERSHRFALRVMRWIALGLGRRAARLVLHPVSAYFLLFAPRARRASRAFLERARGRRATPADLYRHFYAFAATVLDRVYLLHERFDLFDIEVHGTPAPGAGLLLMGAHLGSFEALRATARRSGALRVSIVMYEDNARMLNETLAALGPAARQDVIALGRLDSMLCVRDRVAEGGWVGVLADRGLDEAGARAVPFLGAPARFPLGPMRMAALLRCRVAFMAGLYLGGNRYALHFEPIADFSASANPAPAPEAALETYVACLERHCRGAPYNWFNFYDFWAEADAR